MQFVDFSQVALEKTLKSEAADPVKSKQINFFCFVTILTIKDCIQDALGLGEHADIFQNSCVLIQKASMT